MSGSFWQGALARLERKVKVERSPAAVFEAAIAEESERYLGLKDAVASLLYLRNRLEGDVLECRADLARVYGELRAAERGGDEPWALELSSRRAVLHDALAAIERDLDEAKAEVRQAKAELTRRRAELAALEREKLRVIATLAMARARPADARRSPALDAVREELSKLTAERCLDRELSGESLPAVGLTGYRPESRVSDILSSPGRDVLSS